jgi:hypothetical protein
VGWKIGPFDNFLKVLELRLRGREDLLSCYSRRVLRFEIMLCFRLEEIEVVLPVIFFISRDFDECILCLSYSVNY